MLSSRNDNSVSRLLVCAYACLPEGRTSWSGTGEHLLGWRLAHQLARFCQVTVLTAAELKDRIEKALPKKAFRRMTFVYVALPKFLSFLLRFEGGIHFYAYLWQIKAYWIARRLHRIQPFNAFHHLTYANDWMASYLGAFLPVPYVRGPGGGAHRVPRAFRKEFSVKQRLWESIRVLGQWLYRHDPVFFLGQKRARALLLCNREAMKAVPDEWKPKAFLFPVNGIDKKEIITRKGKGTSRVFRVISAGQFIRLKGFHLGLQAFKKLNAKYPHTKLFIYGDGPEERNLKSLVHSARLTQKVVIGNYLPRKELLSRMREADVFLFPSFRDGGGAVVVEAMASGIPVICLDTGGPGFHIQNMEWGMAIDPRGPGYVIDQMSQALETLCRNLSLRNRLRRAAYQRVREFYDWDKIGDRINRLYQELVWINQ